MNTNIRLFLTLSALVCCTSTFASPDNTPTPFCAPTQEANWRCVLHDVSMPRLLANPAEFHGKRVRTVGYLSLGSADDVIYLHHEDQRNLLYRNGVSILGIRRAKWSKEGHCKSGSYVILEGVFTAADLYSALTTGGTIDAMYCLPKL